MTSADPDPTDETVATVDAVVIGAGVVGLAIARALALAGCVPIVVEAERAIGMHQSSRNSEVIHAGIYYPPASLKARACLEGKRRLYRYCRARDVPHRRCGKLIVATRDHERPVLERLVANAEASGLHDLQPISSSQAHALEPALRCLDAVLSPSTGIIDSHALMKALWADAEDAGASLALATEVVAIEVDSEVDSDSRGRFVVQTRSDRVRTHRVINAAGLGAQAVAAAITGDGVDLTIPTRYLTKGTYFTVSGRPFSRLIYPVPDTASLGIHVTIDMGGNVRFGPDQQWIDALDYALDPGRAAAFVPAIQRYFPDLDPDALQPAYVGVRSKVQAPGDPMADFVVQGPQVHGLPGLVNLFGIESPGLTASLALAAEVLTRLDIAPVLDPGLDPSLDTPGA